MATTNTKFGVLEGTLVYAKLAQADTKYQSTDTEYSVAVIVDEDTADNWDAIFKKQPAKKIRVGDFENKYKIPCPIVGVKNVFEIKLKKDATKDGQPFYPEHRPRVYLDSVDGERTDITESRLLANGTIGKVSYRISENDFGTFAKLNNVLIQEEDFKEYIRTGGGAGYEFGEGKAVKVEEAKESATSSRPVKAKAKPAPEPEDEIEDAPF